MTDTPRRPPASRAAGSGGRRRAARLAAVQALSQIEMNEADPESVILEFLTHRLGAGAEDGRTAIADEMLFADLVRGTTRRKAEIDRALDRVLVEGWPVERLESVLRAILRCGVYELRMRRDIPPRVTINEYVDVAHDFFSGDEPRLVNGVLDRLAHLLRAEDLDNGHGRAAGRG